MIYFHSAFWMLSSIEVLGFFEQNSRPKSSCPCPRPREPMPPTCCCVGLEGMPCVVKVTLRLREKTQVQCLVP